VSWGQLHAREVLLFAETVSIWILAQYVWPDAARSRPARVGYGRAAWVRGGLGSAIAGAATFWVTGGSFALACMVVAGCAVLPWLRTKISNGFAAEFELIATVIILAAIEVAVRASARNPHSFGSVPDTRTAAVLIVAAVLLFSLRNGTYIVRGILDKVGTLPPLDPQSLPRDQFEIDVKEYNRGRLIGNIERLLLVTMVAMHSYEALGFLIAAKGLIRSRELENRSWAEYFLVGTLASTLVALFLGLAIHAAVKLLW
jgi:hypothetical protein